MLIRRVLVLTPAGDFDAALAKCDEVIAREEARQKTLAVTPAVSDADDTSNAVPYILKANFLSQKAFACLQQGMNPAESVEAMEASFKKALALEPNSVDALIQYANIKTMFGAPKAAAGLTDDALPHARNLQEILDILQLNEMTKAQAQVLQDLGVVAPNA